MHYLFGVRWLEKALESEAKGEYRARESKKK